MGIFRSTDPTTWDDVDGIVINESAPAPNIQGVAANIAILVGQSERGLQSLYEVTSIGDFLEKFGKNDAYGMNLALKNKKFGLLKVVRVIASDAALATKTFQTAGAVDAITFSAKQGKGAYGNGITVTIAAGSTSGKKYTITDTNSGTVMLTEVYDNVAIASITANATFASSLLVNVTVVETTNEPASAAATNLASGSNGTVADTDYQTAIGLTEVEGAGNILFLDSYNSTRNGYLKLTAANTEDKMVICAGADTDLYTDAITAVASLRDNDGRIIYAFNPIQTSINGVLSYQSPAFWLASIISQIGPNIDPAYAANVQFTAGAADIKYSLSRSAFIALKNAGICAFENDSDLGIKVKSGIVTQIADSSKLTILRRRMSDYLTYSVAKFLKNYQNAVNSKENRSLVKGAILAFVQGQENVGILPKDSDVQNGKAKLVDTESLNTNSTIAAGFFNILWKQRIFSSMRYLVLSAQIGESVVVTEQQ